MVLKAQPISEEMAARLSSEFQTQRDQASALKAAIDSLQLRQWCIERAVQLCGSELGIMWYSNQEIITQDPPMKCAVVPVAEDILRFITGGDKT